MLTRRQLLMNGAAASTLRFAPSAAGTFALLTLSPSPAYAAWNAWLAAAQTGLSILSTFSGSDGGLGAMMRAQLEKLGIVIEQLANIQQRLTSIELEFKKLDDKIRKILADNYRDTLINGISSAASSYREMLLASQANPAFFDSAPAQDRLRHLAQTANTNRNTLALVQDGYGPETALAVPVACALEVSCSARSGFPQDFIVTILESYREWLNQMIADRPGSILRYRQQAVADHESASLTLNASRLGKLFKTADFKLENKGAQLKSVTAPDYCLAFSNVLASSGSNLVPRDNLMKGLRSIAPMNAGGTYFEHTSELNLAYVEALNTGQLSMIDRGSTVTFARSGALQGNEPKGDNCYVRKAKSIFVVEAATTYATSAEARGDFDLELSRFLVDVDRLNLARARIAFADKASSVVQDTIYRVEDQIEFLKA